MLLRGAELDAIERMGGVRQGWLQIATQEWMASLPSGACVRSIRAAGRIDDMPWRKQSIAFLCAFCTAGFLPLAASSQTADPSRFQQFLASDFHKGLVSRALSLIPTDVFQTCPDLKSSASRIAVTQPVTFGQDGRMHSGAWWERFPVSGCGNDTVLNIYFAVTPDSKINTTTGNPGTTRADLFLQHDALQYAYQAAGAQAKDCSHFDVKDTRFEGYGLH